MAEARWDGDLNKPLNVILEPTIEPARTSADTMAARTTVSNEPPRWTLDPPAVLAPRPGHLTDNSGPTSARIRSRPGLKPAQRQRRPAASCDAAARAGAASVQQVTVGSPRPASGLVAKGGLTR